MVRIAPVALFLGAGANVGHHVGQAFAAKGYKIALVARFLNEEGSTPITWISRHILVTQSLLLKHLQKSNRSSACQAPTTVWSYSFRTILDKLLPGSLKTSNNPQNLFTSSFTEFNCDLTVNITSAYVASQQVMLTFKKLPESALKTFIYTGNILNTATFPGYLYRLFIFGSWKVASAHIIESAAEAYKNKSYKFVSLVPFLKLEGNSPSCRDFTMPMSRRQMVRLPL